MNTHASRSGSIEQMRRVETELLKKGFTLIDGTGTAGLGPKYYRRWTATARQEFDRAVSKVWLVWCEDESQM